MNGLCSVHPSFNPEWSVRPSPRKQPPPPPPPPPPYFTMRRLADSDKSPQWPQVLPDQNDGGLSATLLKTGAHYSKSCPITWIYPRWTQIKLCENIWRDSEGPKLKFTLTAKCLSTFSIFVFPHDGYFILFYFISRPQQNKTWTKVSLSHLNQQIIGLRPTPLQTKILERLV